MENSLFAAHFKQLTEHFGKNGGQSQNGFLDNFPFKAMMNEVMHQGLPGQPQKTPNMDFEDADENYNSSREESRRGSLATPPRSQMDKVSTISIFLARKFKFFFSFTFDRNGQKIDSPRD